MCLNNSNYKIIIDYNIMSGHQMPNLQAGFRNNIGPQQMMEMPQQMAQQMAPQMMQHMVPSQPNMMQAVGGAIDDNVITVLGMAFQKRYVYIFVGLVVLVAGYFLWKWYGESGKSNKKKQYDDEEEDDEDDEDDDEESL